MSLYSSFVTAQAFNYVRVSRCTAGWPASRFDVCPSQHCVSAL